MSRDKTAIAPPKGLTRATRAWFVEVASTWELQEHHLKLLAIAAQAWDECQACAAAVAKDGVLVTTPSGLKKAHPAVKAGNECRAAFERALRELDLDCGGFTEARRPPLLRSLRGKPHAS